MRLARRLITIACQDGWLGIGEQLTHRLSRLVPHIERRFVVRRELRGPTPTPLPNGAAAYHVVSCGEWERYLGPIGPYQRHRVRRLVARADLLVLGTCDRKPVFWMMVRLGRAEIPADFTDGEEADQIAYLFGAFTCRQYRGRGIFPGALLYLSRFLYERSYHALFSKVALSNVASRKSHLRTGFTVLGQEVEARCLGKVWTKATVGDVRCYDHWRDGQGPRSS